MGYPGADLQGGLRGLQPPLLPKTPWKIEVRRREKKRKERREEEERGGWRKKKGDEPPKEQILDPPLGTREWNSQAFAGTAARGHGKQANWQKSAPRRSARVL